MLERYAMIPELTGDEYINHVEKADGELSVDRGVGADEHRPPGRTGIANPKPLPDAGSLKASEAGCLGKVVNAIIENRSHAALCLCSGRTKKTSARFGC